MLLEQDVCPWSMNVILVWTLKTFISYAVINDHASRNRGTGFWGVYDKDCNFFVVYIGVPYV